MWHWLNRIRILNVASVFTFLFVSQSCQWILLRISYSSLCCSGTARTSLIITVGPSARHYSETASTIMFGQRVSTIQKFDGIFFLNMFMFWIVRWEVGPVFFPFQGLFGYSYRNILHDIGPAGPPCPNLLRASPTLNLNPSLWTCWPAGSTKGPMKVFFLFPQDLG